MCEKRAGMCAMIRGGPEHVWKCFWSHFRSHDPWLYSSRLFKSKKTQHHKSVLPRYTSTITFCKVAKRLIWTRASETTIEMLPKRSTSVDQTFWSESTHSQLSVAIFRALRNRLVTQKSLMYFQTCKKGVNPCIPPPRVRKTRDIRSWKYEYLRWNTIVKFSLHIWRRMC